MYHEIVLREYRGRCGGLDGQGGGHQLVAALLAML